MRATPERVAWVSYLRVSTPEQADRELSLPAQRRAVEEFASRHGATLAREYVEAGCSGANPHRPVFRRMLEDVLKPGSDVATIVVHHTSRFTRNSTEARVVKTKLRRIGVRVVSTSHELTDDPIGKLMEGLLECFDQYESEINGVRTAAAMAEAARQGYFPGARTPYGYRTVPVEPRQGVVRHLLDPVAEEASIVREVFRLYIALRGAKAVARQLSQRGFRYRTGVPWTKDLVLAVIDQTAAIGTYYWGKRRANRPRPREDWLPLNVEPILAARRMHPTTLGHAYAHSTISIERANLTVPIAPVGWRAELIRRVHVVLRVRQHASAQACASDSSDSHVRALLRIDVSASRFCCPPVPSG